MRPLYDKLLSHISKSNARFHMPGHNGNNLFCIDNKLDLTELKDLDNLLSSSSCIYESEKYLAKAYSSNYSLMLTQGSTSAMQISMCYSINQGYEIVSIGEMHSSFYNSIRLFGGEMISFSSIEEFNLNRKNIKKKCAIFITSPNYFGQTKEVEKIQKDKEDILVLDAAHGAHFVYSKLLPQLPYENVDIFFVSFHKTMPAITGASALFTQDENIYLNLKYYRSMIHSTSPNYMTMASIDCARDDFEKNGELYYAKIKQVVDSYNGQIGGFNILNKDDFSRLVLQSDGVDANDILEQLHDKGIDIEMAYLDKLVLILTPYNIDKLNKLEKALEQTNKTKLEKKEFNKPLVKAKEIKSYKIDFVDLEKSLGYVCACEIGIYPPSIPVVHSYEIIEEESLKVLIANKDHLFGLVNGKVAVLK